MATVDELILLTKLSLAQVDFIKAAKEFLGEKLPSDIADEAEDAVRTIKKHDLYARLVGKKNEDRVCALFDIMFFDEGSALRKAISPHADRLFREVQLPCGRVDRVITHKDGSATVVEVKQRGSRRDIAQAIGQVLVYSGAIKSSGNYTDVRPAIFVPGDRDEWIENACQLAGIEYITIDDSIAAIEDEVASVIVEWRSVVRG